MSLLHRLSKTKPPRLLQQSRRRISKSKQLTCILPYLWVNANPTAKGKSIWQLKIKFPR